MTLLNRALDRSLRDHKVKLQLLVRKADKDDTLIKALQQELTRLKVFPIAWLRKKKKEFCKINDDLMIICNPSESDRNRSESGK